MFSTGCEPDARQVEGAIARASAAASKGDSQALFQALDQRARFALASVFKARRRAAEVIERSYPGKDRTRALADLGDALLAETPAALFALRCPEPCMDELARRLGPPRSVQRSGRLAQVETVRGERLELYQADNGTYGLVWNSDALRRESSRAFAELDLIKQNAHMYEKRRALQ